MKTTQRLSSAAKEIWDAYSEHPFVLGITCSRYELAFWELAWNMSK